MDNVSEERKQRGREIDKYKKETEYTDLDQGKEVEQERWYILQVRKKRWKSVGVRYENNCCSSQDTALRKSG